MTARFRPNLPCVEARASEIEDDTMDHVDKLGFADASAQSVGEQGESPDPSALRFLRVRFCVRSLRLGSLKLMRERAGQGTVEYAVVAAALLAVIVGIGVLWRAFDAGLFVEHAVASASHHVAGAAGAVIDVFSF